MIKRIVRRVKRYFEPNEFTSLALRREFSELYEVEVGLYTYGCFDHSRIGRKTRFGRYCSVSPSVHIFRRNHGIKYMALTPYLYNASLGVVATDTIPFEPLEISDDVWLGHNCIILPSVSKIGRGAIIAAGSVVTSDVDPYSIVGGNPAKLIRKRFDESTIADIEATFWWTKSPIEIKNDIKTLSKLYFEPEDYFVNTPISKYADFGN